MSFGGSVEPQALKEVMRYAARSGVYFVVSDGNLDVEARCGSIGSTSYQRVEDRCWQFPSDWAGDSNFQPYKLISVSGLERAVKDGQSVIVSALFDRKKQLGVSQIPVLYAPAIYFNSVPDANGKIFPRIGTSYAAPYVTAYISVLLSRYPRCTIHQSLISYSLIRGINPEITPGDSYKNIIDYSKLKC